MYQAGAEYDMNSDTSGGTQHCDFEAGQITSTKISKLTSKILEITSTFDKKNPQNFKNNVKKSVITAQPKSL